MGNMTVKDYTKDVRNVLIEEANALIELANKIELNINVVIDMILNCKGRVIVTGVGKSGIIGKKIVATFSSTGTPSFFLHPSEGLHGDLGMVTKSDIVIALSNSGESDEVLSILPSVKRIGAKLIALVGNENSSLAKKSDVILCIGKVKEACPLGLAPTTSTTLTLALGDALAVALLKARNFKPEHFAIFHPGGTIGKRLLLTISEIIENFDKNPIAYDTCSVHEVIFKMTDSGLGAISIVNDNNQLVGILTDGDLRRALRSGTEFLDQPIKTLYTENPICVEESMLAAEALNIMEIKKINVLPVIDKDKKPISMIHIHDLTRIGL